MQHPSTYLDCLDKQQILINSMQANYLSFQIAHGWPELKAKSVTL